MKYYFALVLLFLSSCQSDKGPPTRPPVEVTTYTVQQKTIPAYFTYVGVAQSSHLVEIRARVEGYLDKIAYKEGDFVNKGDLLFQLDPRPFEAQVAEYKADLANQKANFWNAKRIKERLEPLFAQKAASRKDLDDSIAQELSAEAAVQGAEAKLQLADLDLSYTAIHSPISGLSSQSNFREGALITPGSTGLLTTISVIDPIWVNFSVSEGDILKHREDALKGRLTFPKDMDFEIEVTLADGTTFPSRGKVNFAEPSLKQSTGTMMVRAIFDNPKMLLRPGQFVRATLIGALRPQAIAIPQTAVQQGQRGMFVYVAHEGVAEQRPVEVGDWFDNLWVISEGLHPGEQVIVGGVNKVQAGTPIKVMP